MTLLIKSVKIPPGLNEVDIFVMNGKIKLIKKIVTEKAATVINGRGALALPGFFDLHAHVYDPSILRHSDFETETKKALKGGVTTIIEMPTKKQVMKKDEIKEKVKIGKKQSWIDFGLHAGNISNENIGYMDEAVALGVRSFKGFTCPPYKLAQRDILKFLEKIKEKKCTPIFHCENEKFFTKKDFYPDSRPNIAEEQAILKMLKIARKMRVKLHIAHLTTSEGMVAVEKYRNEKITCEVTPHHLVFTKEAMRRKGNIFKTDPPLRSQTDVECLWHALKAGKIDFVATDHFFSPKEEKAALGLSGIASLELVLALIFSEGVVKRKLSLSRFIKITSENPSKWFGVYPAKGVLRVGSEADIVLLNPKHEWRVKACESAYNGLKITGRIESTITHGILAYHQGEFQERCLGNYIKNKNYSDYNA